MWPIRRLASENECPQLKEETPAIGRHRAGVLPFEVPSAKAEAHRGAAPLEKNDGLLHRYPDAPRQRYADKKPREDRSRSQERAAAYNPGAAIGRFLVPCRHGLDFRAAHIAFLGDVMNGE